mgnify:CR=1 FL=1
MTIRARPWLAGPGCTLKSFRLSAARSGLILSFPSRPGLGQRLYWMAVAVVGDVSEAAKIFETAGIDMLSLSGGMSVFFRPGHTEAGYFAELSAAAKKGTTLPVLLTGGIADGAKAEFFLEKGQADLIGIGRAALRDHQIYQKILSM